MPDQYITILGPASVVPNAATLAAMCGVPEGVIEYSIVPGFNYSIGPDYVINTTDLNAAGIFSTGLGPLPNLIVR